MHGSRCTVQVQVTNLLLKFLLPFNAVVQLTQLQMIGQLCVCEHKRSNNGIHRSINVYSKILVVLYTYAGTQSLQTSNIMVRATNSSLYSLVQRLETPKCIRGAMSSCTIESDLVDKTIMQTMFSSHTPLLRYIYPVGEVNNAALYVFH